MRKTSLSHRVRRRSVQRTARATGNLRQTPCDVSETKTLDFYATPSKQRPPIGIIERLNPSRGRDDAECNQALVVVRLISDNHC
jgi:hypothetical protein